MADSLVNVCGEKEEAGRPRRPRYVELVSADEMDRRTGRPTVQCMLSVSAAGWCHLGRAFFRVG